MEVEEAKAFPPKGARGLIEADRTGGKAQFVVVFYGGGQPVIGERRGGALRISPDAQDDPAGAADQLPGGA